MADIFEDVTKAYEDANGAQQIFALMGPNGAGKSRLLSQMHEDMRERGTPHIFVPPLRQIQNERILSRPAPKGTTTEALWSDIISGLGNDSARPMRKGESPSNAAEEALRVLVFSAQSATEQSKKEHASKLVQWQESGMQGPVPPLPSEKPIQEVEITISRILGFEARVTYKEDQRFEVQFKKGEVSFGLHGLSSGEKQLILIAAFALGTSSDRLVFLVDEPELYLNEARAVEVWERLESCFPKSVFLYATHSPTFATRPTVQKTYIIREPGAIEAIDRNAPVSSTVLRDIVGTRIQLLREEGHPIFCEDDLAKFILKDLFDGSACFPVGLSGCGSVISASKREHAWQALRSEGPKSCGVIDRDARFQEDIANLENSGVFCFPRYESEAILIDPQVLIWSCKKNGHRNRQRRIHQHIN